jgi:hypothetical protein
MAGYSKTPLAKKLGVKPGARMVLVSAPDGFGDSLQPLPGAVRLSSEDAGGIAELDQDVDVFILFCRSASDLSRSLRPAASRLATAGGLLVAWPKKSSGLETDLDFAAVQQAGLDLGLVDNKVCAVEQTFSGLRFVVRRENRAAWAAGRRL